MKLRICFAPDVFGEIIDWSKNLLEFPQIIQKEGKKYEWVSYEPNVLLDFTLTFGLLPTHDPRINDIAVEWEDILKGAINPCECGAKHSRSFPWDHMKFCKLWIPW